MVEKNKSVSHEDNRNTGMKLNGMAVGLVTTSDNVYGTVVVIDNRRFKFKFKDASECFDRAKVLSEGQV